MSLNMIRITGTDWVVIFRYGTEISGDGCVAGGGGVSV